MLAAGAWAVTFCTLGFLFWRSIDQLTTYVSRGLFAFGTLVVLIGGIVALIHLRRSPEARRRVREWIDARDDRPGWRIVAKLSRPVWHLVLKPAATVADLAARFGQDRVTPGNLGLELTTLLALLAVGTFSFFLLGDIVMMPGDPRIDRWAFSVAGELRTGRARRRGEGGDRLRRLSGHRLAMRATALWARAQAAPDRRARARHRLAARLRAPPTSPRTLRPAAAAGALVETVNPAYPSGHSAYAVALVACATVLVRGGVGWAARVAAVTVALVLVAVVAVTRVYLRAHYLTDVLGGIALGVAVWSLIGVLALAAWRIRHNEGHVMSDDEKTYLIAGAAAAISLIAWLALVVVPAWRSYWRLRDRLVATILSLYVLAAFVLAGAGVGAVALWYFSDRVSI